MTDEPTTPPISSQDAAFTPAPNSPPISPETSASPEAAMPSVNSNPMPMTEDATSASEVETIPQEVSPSVNPEPVARNRSVNSKGTRDFLGPKLSQLTNVDKQSEPKFEDEIIDSEERPFKSLSGDLLKARKQLIQKEIQTSYDREERLIDEIKETDAGLAESYGEAHRKDQKKIKRLELERENLNEKRRELEKENQEISKEQERREQESIDISDRSILIQVKELYRLNDLAEDAIINAILYTATFFSDLPPNDFKGVVFEFLKGKKGKIKNLAEKENPTDQESIPTFTHVDLEQYWQENLSQGNRFLEACHLKAKRENGTLVIDFSLPNLRDNLSKYIQEEQPLFFDEQLERVETLLFHPSKKVSEQATHLLAEAATYQGVDWLLKIAGKAAETEPEYFFDRIADLIYQIQLRLKPDQSEGILIRFFSALLYITPKNAFATILRLLYRHLRSQLSFNILNAATQLLKWLQEIIDNGEESQQEQAKMVLWWLLNLNDTDIYLYDLLELLSAWLPEPGLSIQEYKPSHKVLLNLMFEYFQDTLSDIQINDYGECPPKYVLFKPLWHSKDKLDPARSSKLNMLVSWLFFRDNKKNFALESILLGEDSSEDEVSDFDLAIGFIVLEWFAILYGLRKDEEPTPQTKEFASDLLKQIIAVTERSEQRQLLEWWTVLIEIFLDEAEKYDQQGNSSLRKQFIVRRNRAKELKQLFKQLQQEGQQ
jgi:hypothetical protein